MPYENFPIVTCGKMGGRAHLVDTNANRTNGKTVKYEKSNLFMVSRDQVCSDIHLSDINKILSGVGN